MLNRNDNDKTNSNADDSNKTTSIAKDNDKTTSIPDNNDKTTSIADIPTETLVDIFKFFDKFELAKVGEVNKEFNLISKEKSLTKNAAYPLFKDYSRFLANQSYTISAHTNGRSISTVNCIAEIEPNKIAVAYSIDGRLKIWDIETRKCIHELDTGTREATYYIEKISDSKMVTACPIGKTLYVWDIQTWDCLKQIKICNNDNSTTEICFTKISDHEIASVSDLDGMLRIWDIEKKENACIQEFKCYTTNDDYRFDFTSSGSDSDSEDDTSDENNSDSDDNDTHSVESGTEDADKKTHCLTDHPGQSGSTSGSASGSASASDVDDEEEGLPCILNIDNNKVAHSFGDKKLRVWDLITGECKQILTNASCVVSIAQMADGTIICGLFNGTMQIWNIQTGQCINTLIAHPYLPATTHSSQVRTHSNTNFTQTNFDDAANNSSSESYDDYYSYCVSRITVLSDEEVVCGLGTGELQMWNVKTGNCIQKIAAHHEAVVSIIKHSSNAIISGSSDESVKFWSFPFKKSRLVLGDISVNVAAHPDQATTEPEAEPDNSVATSNTSTFKR